MSNHHFGALNPRTAAMRERILGTQPSVCTERAALATQAYRLHERDQVVLKRAYMLDNVLRNMSIYIDEDGLLAGNQAGTDRGAPIFPEYAMDWVMAELDAIQQRDGDRFIVSENSKQLIRNIYPYWKGRTLHDKGYAAFPEHARLFYDLGIIKTEGNITSGDGHIAVDYGYVLREGLAGVRARLREAESCLALTRYDDLKKSYFYRAIAIVLDAVEAFSLRYAALADEQARGHNNAKRAAELRELARICRKVPMHPAETFHEALQSVWLLHVALQIESNGHSLSYGRFDQYMTPCYFASRDSGMTEETACELLENLWIRTFSINKIRSGSHTRFSAGSPLYQNVTIGGQTPDGKDAVNELSLLVLRTVARCRLPQPNLTVRYHSGLSADFMRECVEVIRCGFGMPAFNNDQVIVPSLARLGVHARDALDYSAIGCVEVAVPGKWGYRCTGMSFLNFPNSAHRAKRWRGHGQRTAPGTCHRPFSGHAKF